MIEICIEDGVSLYIIRNMWVCKESLLGKRTNSWGKMERNDNGTGHDKKFYSCPSEG